MPPHELLRYTYAPGQIVLGKFAGRLIGHLDDRPQITIAGARAGKTSTILEPNLCLYPGSMLVLDPKRELAQTARLRRALGHDVYVLDPFAPRGNAERLLQCFERARSRQRDDCRRCRGDHAGADRRATATRARNTGTIARGRCCSASSC